MAKILLVEDDNNLREIYEARLQAEGYTIVSAMDGEAALVVAKKEQPELIISDVMMPRVSGFEMLDILRNTNGLKDVKVIMLTALGQAEDKTRADALGADRYLVKSQVTLEDIVHAAQELLGPSDQPASAAPSTTPAQPAQTPAATPAAPTVSNPVPVSSPIAVATSPSTPNTTSAPSITSGQAAQPTPVATPTGPSSTPVVTQPVTTSPAQPVVAAPTTQPVAAPVEPHAPASSTTPAAEPPPNTPTPTSPPPLPETTPPAPATALNVQSTTPNVTTPADAPATATSSVAPEPAAPVSTTAPVVSIVPAESADDDIQSTSDEEAAIKTQIENFVNQNSQAAQQAPTPADSTHAMMANAIKDLVSDTAKPTPELKAPQVIQPPTHVEPPATPASSTPVQTQPSPQVVSPKPPAAEPQTAYQLVAPAPQTGSVPVAHKKIISPIPSTTKPPTNLDELLAKEGITNLDPEPATPQSTAYSSPQPPNAPPQSFQQPATPTNMPTSPHQPGHVISPNATSGVDPNTIAL